MAEQRHRWRSAWRELPKLLRRPEAARRLSAPTGVSVPSASTRKAVGLRRELLKWHTVSRSQNVVAEAQDEGECLLMAASRRRQVTAQQSLRPFPTS